jgi:esterase/lipase superfamily enzyme
MGSMVTLEALRQVYAQHRASVADRLGAIVFASPDLDIDGFSSSVRRMGRLAERMTIITASDDRALAMAANISGGGRVGSAEKARLETLGLKVVDASGLGWGILNHDLFLTNDQVKRVIRQAIEETRTPNYARSVSAEPLPAPMQ